MSKGNTNHRDNAAISAGDRGQRDRIRVINVISDSNVGGAGRMLLTFLKNFDRGEFDVSVVIPTGAALLPALEELGVGIATIDGLAERSLNLSIVNKLRKLFVREKPDIVHTHASMSARIAAKAARCALIYTRHSVFANSKMKTRFPVRQLIGAVNNFLADAVIAVSPAAMDMLVEAGQAKRKIHVIYNGVDAIGRLDSRGRDAERERYGIGGEDFVCGIFARLTPVKGHEYVLDAAEMLKAAGGIKFVIAGTGEIEEELKLRASSAGLDNVIFTGFLPDAGKLMAAIDVQLNASYGTEATSLALLEGMSVGVPAIASSFGGNPYVVTDSVSGLIFPERDAEALAKAIMKLRDDKAVYSMLSANAESSYNERFTARRMTGEIEELYRLVRGKRR